MTSTYILYELWCCSQIIAHIFFFVNIQLNKSKYPNKYKFCDYRTKSKSTIVTNEVQSLWIYLICPEILYI